MGFSSSKEPAFTPANRKTTWQDALTWPGKNPIHVALFASIIATLTYFYVFVPFSPASGYSILVWAWSNWVPDREYFHARFVPLIMGGLIWRLRKEILVTPKSSNLFGIIVILIGIFFFIAAFRTVQGRLGLFSLPIVLFGIIWTIWGRKTAYILIFPIFILWFTIPLPGFQQATVHLQLLSTKVAHLISQFAGVDATLQGNYIFSNTEKWNFSIAEGCSGIRSLMALTMVAAIYAHINQKSLVGKAIVFLSSFPLAIISNCIRVTTIILIAEYLNPKFAAGLYHDYSAFLFFPIAVIGLVLVNRLLSPKKPTSIRRKIKT